MKVSFAGVVPSQPDAVELTTPKRKWSEAPHHPPTRLFWSMTIAASRTRYVDAACNQVGRRPAGPRPNPCGPWQRARLSWTEVRRGVFACTAAPISTSRLGYRGWVEWILFFRPGSSFAVWCVCVCGFSHRVRVRWSHRVQLDAVYLHPLHLLDLSDTAERPRAFGHRLWMKIGHTRIPRTNFAKLKLCSTYYFLFIKCVTPFVSVNIFSLFIIKVLIIYCSYLGKICLEMCALLSCTVSSTIIICFPIFLFFFFNFAEHFK